MPVGVGVAPAVGLAVVYGALVGEGDSVLVDGGELACVGDIVATGEAAYGLGDRATGEGTGVSCGVGDRGLGGPGSLLA